MECQLVPFMGKQKNLKIPYKNKVLKKICKSVILQIFPFQMPITYFTNKTPILQQLIRFF